MRKPSSCDLSTLQRLPQRTLVFRARADHSLRVDISTNLPVQLLHATQNLRDFTDRLFRPASSTRYAPPDMQADVTTPQLKDACLATFFTFVLLCGQYLGLLYYHRSPRYVTHFRGAGKETRTARTFLLLCFLAAVVAVVCIGVFFAKRERQEPTIRYFAVWDGMLVLLVNGFVVLPAFPCRTRWC